MRATAGATLPTHDSEAHSGGAGRLNWLRAGVLGANDGIVSVAGIVVGVAGATAARGPIFTAGLAGLVAGAVSMALGEYVSVSSQRDSEHALMAQERRELRESPRGRTRRAHRSLPGEGSSAGHRPHGRRRAHRPRRPRRPPGRRAGHRSRRPGQPASGRRGLGAVVHPRGAAAIARDPAAPSAWRVPCASLAVLAALALTGVVSARLGGANPRRAVLRVLIGGAVGLAFTYGIGHLVGTAAS